MLRMSLQVHYASSPVGDYVRAAVSAACDIHREGLPGDILIFLTGVAPFTLQRLSACNHSMRRSSIVASLAAASNAE